MPIDYRLAFEALEGMGKPIGQDVVAGVDAFNRIQDRQRQNEQFEKMQSLGQFVGQEFTGGQPDYQAITGRVAEVDPMQAIAIDQQRRAMADKFKLAQLKNRPDIAPSVLQSGAAAKLKSRQLLNTIANSDDQAMVDQAKQEYEQLFQNYSTTTQPQLLGLKDSSNKLEQLEIKPLDDALMSLKERKMELSSGQADLNEKLRAGAIKDSQFITKSISDYDDLASRDGMSLNQTSNIATTLETAKRLADQGSVAGMHALNILTNKTLDPNSAVLLSEAEAFDEQDLASILKRLGASLVGIDPKTFNVPNVYKLAKENISARSANAKKLAEGKMERINKELKHMKSPRQIKIEDMSPFAGTEKRVSYEDL